MKKAIRRLFYKPQHMKTRFTVAQKRRFLVRCIEMAIYAAAVLVLSAAVLAILDYSFSKGVM